MKLRISLFIAICFCFLITNNSFGQNNKSTIKKLELKSTTLTPVGEAKDSEKGNIVKKKPINEEVGVKKHTPTMVDHSAANQTTVPSSVGATIPGQSGGRDTEVIVGQGPKQTTLTTKPSNKRAVTKASLKSDIKGLQFKVKVLTDKDAVKYKANIKALEAKIADKQRLLKALK